MASFRSLRRLVPGQQQVSASEFNALLDELERVLNFSVQPPLVLDQAGTAFRLRLEDEGFFPAKITGGSNPYSWVEQDRQEDGSFIDKPFGRSGTTSQFPAYEINALTRVQENTYVWMTRGYPAVDHGLEFIFSATIAEPNGYYDRQGLFCVDIDKQKCVDGVMIDDSISIHSNVPIWMSRGKCSNPTGQGSGSGGPTCPNGWVDTSTDTSKDCDKGTYSFAVSGVTTGTCGNCLTLNTNYSVTYRKGSQWLGGTINVASCGSVYYFLRHGGGYYELVFSSTSGTMIYRLNAVSWTAGGPNTLTRYGTGDPGWCNNWPATITVS